MMIATMMKDPLKYQTPTSSVQVPGAVLAVEWVFFATILNCMFLPAYTLSMSMSMPTPPNANTNSKVNPHMSGAEKLRRLCNGRRSKNSGSTNRAIVLPGIHDALSAKIFADAGAEALFLSGFGVSASKLGQPDVGLLTQTEMEDTIRSIVQALPKAIPSGSTSEGALEGERGCQSPPPLIADADTGFGGPLNIRRTVRGFASAGAAAITIEDQEFPKKCTYAAGKGVKVISRKDCRERIEVAIAARDEAKCIDGNDVLIVARTDCRAALGLEEAVARCKLFEEAGADICYAENLQSRDEYEYLRESLHPYTITMLAQVQLFPSSKEENDDGDDCKNKQFLFSADEIGEMGYDLALYGVTALQSVVYALKQTASDIFDKSTPGSILTHDVPLTSFSDLKETVGFPEAEKFVSLYEKTNE